MAAVKLVQRSIVFVLVVGLCSTAAGFVLNVLGEPYWGNFYDLKSTLVVLFLMLVLVGIPVVAAAMLLVVPMAGLVQWRSRTAGHDSLAANAALVIYAGLALFVSMHYWVRGWPSDEAAGSQATPRIFETSVATEFAGIPILVFSVVFGWLIFVRWGTASGRSGVVK